MIKKLILALGLTTLSLSATACNTEQGLGEDISSGGKAGDEAID